jgi:hypothetical protein
MSSEKPEDLDRLLPDGCGRSHSPKLPCRELKAKRRTLLPKQIEEFRLELGFLNLAASRLDGGVMLAVLKSLNLDERFDRPFYIGPPQAHDIRPTVIYVTHALRNSEIDRMSQQLADLLERGNEKQCRFFPRQLQSHFALYLREHNQANKLKDLRQAIIGHRQRRCFVLQLGRDRVSDNHQSEHLPKKSPGAIRDCVCRHAEREGTQDVRHPHVSRLHDLAHLVTHERFDARKDA